MKPDIYATYVFVYDLVLIGIKQEVHVECEEENKYDAHDAPRFVRRVPTLGRSGILAVHTEQHAHHSVETHGCACPRRQLWQEVGQE